MRARNKKMKMFHKR